MAAGLLRRWQSLAVIAPIVAVACGGHPAAPTSGSNGPGATPTGSIHGVVRDAIPANMGAPVPGALVEILYQTGGSRSTTTGADGSYRLDDVRSGESFRLNVTRAGYVAASKVAAVAADDAAIDVRLMPIVVNVSGIVTEAGPAAGRPVDSAIVTITSGSNAGRAFASDAAGAFTMTAVWAEFDISVARAGFDTAGAHVDATSGARVAVQLKPVVNRAHAEFSGALCTIAPLPPWLNCTAPFERTHVIAVVRPGSLALTVNYVYVGDYYLNSLTLDVRCGSRIVAQKRFVKQWEAPPIVLPDNRVGTFEIPVAETCNYDLRLWNFIADTKGGSQTTYRVDVEYPR